MSELRKVLTGPAGLGTATVRMIELAFDALKGTREAEAVLAEVAGLLGLAADKPDSVR